MYGIDSCVVNKKVIRVMEIFVSMCKVPLKEHNVYGKGMIMDGIFPMR